MKNLGNSLLKVKKIEQLNKCSRLNGDPHQKIHTLEPVHMTLFGKTTLQIKLS